MKAGAKITSHFETPMHPAWLRCESLTYLDMPALSRLARQAPQYLISSFEDKLVESALKRVLEPIYETMFEDNSYGYRPGLGAHQCLDELGRTIQQKYVNHVVEADIRSFFDKVNHQWMVKFLQHRIGDPRIIRLINRVLKAGIMEDGLVRASEQGTPQGSILSPLLSNIYLHYTLKILGRNNQWNEKLR
jgi:retron-type reverse transcriptase